MAHSGYHCRANIAKKPTFCGTRRIAGMVGVLISAAA
jgi:hypothetical protein